MVLPPGKLPPDLQAALLSHVSLGSNVILGPGIGEDAAVVEVEERYLILANDPVTLSDEPGAIAVQINANDVAVTGGEPRWLLATILLPEGTEQVTVEGIMGGLLDACEELDVSLIGGHTEVTSSVTRPVVIATMVGEVFPDRLVTSAGASTGDRLILAQPVAIEGTAILARERESLLRQRGVPEDVIAQGARLAVDPGISVLPAVRALTARVVPHAMHDPTEGGLLAAVREVAAASDVGVSLDAGRVPVLPETRTITDALGLDPLALLASGSLLAAVTPSDVTAALAALADAGIPSAEIGVLQAVTDGMILRRGGREMPLPVVVRDELTRL
ncbi:MAG TPA: AIR synthase related protein [Chloroflexota bacterium]|nr:AIR synthase related protein [Chloroflexota bacterium]